MTKAIENIKAVGNRIQLRIDKPKAGVMNTDNLNVAKEVGEVIGIGNLVKTVKVGDTVMFKAWAVDIISHGGEKYYFLAEDTNGICAVIK